MDIRLLEAFRFIAEGGSFSLAARRLGRSQSALSQQIRTLESQVGEPLLVRARPRAYPTHTGQRLLVRAERIFSEMACIKDEFEQSSRGEVQGTVRIAATPLAITYLYGGLLAHFIAHYPKIEIIVHATETTQDPVTRVLQRSADVGFTVFPQPNPNLALFPMVYAEQVFIVGTKHPLAESNAVTLQELRKYPFVRFEHRTGQRMISDALFLKGGGYPPVLAESNEMEYVKRLVRMGLGTALVPVFCVRQELKEGVLRAVRARTGRSMQEAGIVSHKEATVRSVVTFLKACEQLRGRKPRLLSLDNATQAPFERRP